MNGNPPVPVQVLVDAQARLGECPLWCEQRQTLYWTDIQSATLYAWHQADGRTQQWSLPERVGSFALTATAGQLLLGLASGIALYNLDTQTLGPVTPVEADEPRTRINDGRCDPQGRFVFGMFNQDDDGVPVGHFYRVGPDLAVERLPLPPVACANSLAFSPDGSTVYLTDTPTREIRCADYHANGRIGPLQTFVRLGADEGFPDGSCIDADGGLWNAQWEGRCVVRYDADGRETDRITLPASRLTCPAFLGPQRDQLVITSARVGLDAAVLQAQPQAGAVFITTPGRAGVPEHRFLTALRA